MINKYKASNVDAKKFTWILCNINNFFMVFKIQKKN